MKNFEDIKKLIKDKDLLDLALTHRSWGNENKNIRGSNERLEFLGDAVLELVVTDKLYRYLPDKEEGYLTALRARLVNKKSLATLARTLNLGEHLYLAKGVEDSNGRESDYLLANSVESIIGAIYLDLGLEKAKKFIEDNLFADLDKKIAEPLKDPKSSLQEYFQLKKKITPRYKTVKEVGPDNAKEFTIQVEVAGKVLGQGTGSTKQEAQQKAASVAMESINDQA